MIPAILFGIILGFSSFAGYKQIYTEWKDTTLEQRTEWYQNGYDEGKDSYDQYRLPINEYYRNQEALKQLKRNDSI